MSSALATKVNSLLSILRRSPAAKCANPLKLAFLSGVLRRCADAKPNSTKRRCGALSHRFTDRPNPFLGLAVKAVTLSLPPGVTWPLYSSRLSISSRNILRGDVPRISSRKQLSAKWNQSSIEQRKQILHFIWLGIDAAMNFPSDLNYVSKEIVGRDN